MCFTSPLIVVTLVLLRPRRRSKRLCVSGPLREELQNQRHLHSRTGGGLQLHVGPAHVRPLTTVPHGRLWLTGTRSSSSQTLVVVNHNNFNLTLRLTNNGDDSFNTKLYLYYPPGLSFSMLNRLTVSRQRPYFIQRRRDARRLSLCSSVLNSRAGRRCRPVRTWRGSSTRPCVGSTSPCTTVGPT